MALLDFLTKDIGGMTGAGKGATGLQWGNALTQMAQGYNAKQLSPFASPLVSQYPGTTGQQPAQIQLMPLQGPQKKQQSSVGDMVGILKMLGGIFGIPL